MGPKKSNQSSRKSQKNAKSQNTAKISQLETRQQLKYSSPQLQQSLLSLLQRTFSSVFADYDTLTTTIQTVKANLYARDYRAAFDSPDCLLAYVVRWSSSRALAYLHVFGDLCPQIPQLLTASSQKRVLCVGGGAGGEVLALAALACDLNAQNVNISAVDISDWDDVFARLRSGMAREWQAAAVKLDNAEASDTANNSISMQFEQFDILDAPCRLDVTKSHVSLDTEDIAVSISNTAPCLDFSLIDLITILFTTNELFAESKPRTMTFLHYISEVCKPGALLLIIESAGSYSHIQIGSKTFPVQLLLDHTLVSESSSSSKKGWEKLIEDDSVWFRVDEKKVTYPLQLENMRFFMRLYRKL
ncbi:uncharacterized protein V2V93DRAFT_364559 [Kockiozyma suomiensis]|uniref:uncharacterized protein n=1 Tax=Kockiozyma suomiensis TaxID=1337062 RepID=UPI0033437C1A